MTILYAVTVFAAIGAGTLLAVLITIAGRDDD